MRYTFVWLILWLVVYPDIGLTELNIIFRATGKTKSEQFRGGFSKPAQAGF